jgi:4-hydroxy-3-polyprenylbenzoate decarboxylase
MGYYKDLRQHVEALEENGKLVRIRREINKDTELMPLVRWQFRGLPEKERKAFLFDNVVDVKERKYRFPVLVGSHAASTEVYALALMCRPEEINERWTQAQLHPIQPEVVATGPIHQEVHIGDGLLEHGGLGEFPNPISTPGFDNAPYLTCANFVTKDPDTGITNIGNYRGMVKSATRTGICAAATQHLRINWTRCKDKGIPLQAAIVIGAAPNIGLVSSTKVPYEADEYAIAGGLADEPVELVKCRTVDIDVPATAEIVIEGEIPTDSLEREAPFGEFPGHMGMPIVGPYFNATCIMHRKDAIYNAFLSQFPPTESSVMLHKFLKYDCKIPGLLDVAVYESGGPGEFFVIKMSKSHPSVVWQALYGVIAFSATHSKTVIVVDEDIDPRDPDSVIWALSFRMQPHQDIRIITGRGAPLDPSTAFPWTSDPERYYPPPNGASSVLINATRKWDYPPVSLPKKEFMERARKIWEEEGLPVITPKTPWFGYNLGYWTEELAEEAELALKGEHYVTGEKLAKNRVKS